MTGDPTKRKVLYERLSADGYNLGTLDEFSSKMENPENVRILYDAITKDGYEVGQYADFSAKIGPSLPVAKPSPAPPMDDKLSAAIYGDAVAVPDAVQLPAPAKVQQRAEQGISFYNREGGEEGMKRRSQNLTAMNVADANMSWKDMPRVQQDKKNVETEKLAIKKIEEHMTQRVGDLSASEQALSQQAESYKELIANNPEMADQLRAEYDQALEQHNRKVAELNELNKVYTAYQRKVGIDEQAILRREAQLNEDVGNPIDLVWNKLIGHAGAVPSAIGDMSLGAVLDLAENTGIIDPDTRKAYEAEFSPMDGRENLVESISDPASRIFGADKVTNEYEAKAMDNLFVGTALGLVEQAPALALTFSGNIPAATMVYLAQGYENGMKETSGEEWNDIPPPERRAMAVLNAGIESALESFGASEMIGKTQFTRELTKDILTKMRPGMSPGEITRLINGETSSFFANYAARMLPRMAAEAATETETSLLQGTTKDIYEWAKSGELGDGAQQLFNNPETADALLDEMKKSALMGAIGAGYSGTIPAISESVSGKKDFADKTPRQFALIEKIVSDPEFVKTWKAEADVAVKQGKVKQAEVDKILDDIATVKKVVDKLPEDLPAEKRGQAASLLLQKDKLSKKERSLVADQITAIDEQLAALAKKPQVKTEETQAATEEAAPVAEPAEVPAPEQATGSGVGIRDTAGIERLISELDPAKQDRAKAVVEGTARTLGILEQLGDIDVVLHKDGSTMPKGGESAKGVVTIPKIDKDGNVKSEMHINLSTADQWTGAHETTHIGLRRAFGDNPKLYAHFRDRLQKILREGDFTAINDIAAKAQRRSKNPEYEKAGYEIVGDIYSSEDTPEEFLSNLVQEMVSRLGRGEALTPKERTAIQKIVDLFNEVLRAIGIKPQNLEFKTDQELFDYFNGLAQAIQSDSKLKEEWLNKRADVRPGAQSDGVIGSYAGPKAEFKGDEKDRYRSALVLGRSGADNEDIRQTTGWFSGVGDGKMRFEFSDKDAVVAIDPDSIEYQDISEGKQPSRVSLQEVYQHDKLYELYPAARNIKVAFVSGLGSPAKYSPASNTIFIDKSSDNIKSSFVHEIQHWIDKREGRSYGADPKTALQNTDKAGLAKMYPLAATEYGRDVANAMKERRFGDIDSKILDELGYIAYRSDIGEIHARDAQSRMDLDESGIARKKPYSDILPAELYLAHDTPDAVVVRSEGDDQKIDPKRERTYEKLYSDAIDYIEQYDVTSKLTLEQVEAEWMAKHARDIDLAKAVISNLNKQLKESQKQILDAAKDGFTKGMDKGAAMAEAEGRINVVAAIRDERAQRRAVADAVNAKIKELGRGKISTAQARLITKAALSVKPGDQASMDKFTQLVDKVMSNMIIANQLAGVEKLQAKAGKRKGGAAESVYVQPFVRIKPYDIPENLIGDYVQALNELSQRVPKYGTMLRLKDQIAAAKEAGEQSRKHPFDAVKTKDELDQLAQNMGGEIKTVDEYRQAIRDAAAYQRALIRLLDTPVNKGGIDQATYDKLSDQGSKSIDEFNAKNEQEMSALKNAIIADIKALDTDLSKVDFITKERNDLVSKATELNDAELSSLTPVELDDLHQALENAAIDGTVDVAKISDIILSAKLNTYRSEMEQVIDRAERTAGSAKQNAKRKSSVEVKSPSFWANELGFSSKHGNVVDSQVIDPINTAVSDADILRKDTLKAMRDLMKKHGIKSPWDPKRFVRGEKTAVVFDRLGMIVKYMEEYEQGLATDFKDDVGKRDYFADLLSDPGTSNSVTDVGRQDTMDNWRAVWSKLPKKDGRVDVEALYDSVEKNDGRYFPKNEVSFLKEAIAWNNKHLMPKQEFINNWRNQTFSPLGWYMPRVALTKKGDAGIIGESDLVNDVVKGRLTTRSSSGYERTDNSVKPIETNFIKLMDIHANQVGRDYFVSQAVERSRQALAKMRKLADQSGKQEAKWKVEALSLMLKEKTKQAVEVTKQSNADKAVNTALSALTKRLLANPIRIFPEIAAFIPEGAARGQGVKSVATGARLAKIVGGIQEVDKIMELTGSSVREAGGSAKYLDQRAGEVREENIVSKAVHFISDPVGSLLTKQAWLGVFAREFKNMTGETLDLDKLRTSKIYRGTYAKEIEAARSAADNINNRIRTAANAFDKPLKRRTPLGRMDSDSAGAKLFGYLTGYTSRQLDAAMAEFREAIDNAKTGEGSAKDFGSALLTSGMLVGSGMIYSGLRTYLNAAAAYVTLNALASAADDEEDKKRYEEAAEEALKNLELVQDTDEWFAKAAASLGEMAASSAINIGTSGNPAAYRLAIRGLASLAYWKAQEDKVDTAGLSGEILKNAQRRNREVDARLAAIAEITRRYTFADPFNVDRSTSLSTSMDLIAGALPVTTAVKFILDDAKNIMQTVENEPEYLDSDTGQQKVRALAAVSVSLFNIFGLMKGLALPSVATNKEMQNVRKQREATKEKKMMTEPSGDAILSKAMTEAQKKAAEEAAKNMSILELILGEETPDNQ